MRLGRHFGRKRPNHRVTRGLVIGLRTFTKLAVEGDSITAASGSSYSERWAAANPAVAYYNSAVGGSGMSGCMSRLSTLMATNPSDVSLRIGANDMMSYASTQAYVDDVFAYFAAARAIDPTVVRWVCSPSHLDESAAANVGKTGFNARLDAACALFRAAVGTQIDGYIPLGEHPTLTAAAMVAGGTYSTDGLHLLSTGQVLEYGVFAAAMDSRVQGDTGTNPDAFTLTDTTGAALSTAYTSQVLTTGLGVGQVAANSITGSGTMKRGQGTLGTTGFNVMNGDITTVSLTSSGSASTALSTVLTSGSQSDTMTVSTSAPSITQSADLMFWWDPSDPSTLAQTNTGTGTVGTDGDVVGTMSDKSAGAVHLTSTGNDTTRPLWHTSGGLKWLNFDGSNDVLRRMSSTLPIGMGQSWTLIFALKPNPGGASKILFGLRGATSGNPCRVPMASQNPTAANGALFYRDAPGTSFATGGNISTNAFTNLWDNALHVYAFVCNGSTIKIYKDQTLGATITVSEGALDFTGTVNLGLGAGFAAAAGNWFATDFYQGAGWNVALGSTALAAEITRQGALQGRTI